MLLIRCARAADSGSRPNAVTQVTGGTVSIPPTTCDVAYGLKDLPVSISKNGYRLTLDYDAEGMVASALSGRIVYLYR